ncbi:uncharacterized protein LOC111598980 [Drosophila hydei]|uniref:Uncharacterized protein LOC111598980 n=1 Tax=Drosophila hydei TaxID=7224 RepID=A0A6J1LR84_DROHY|nr:uncharacterized protein LOC111598980 [Drosophila hydei]
MKRVACKSRINREDSRRQSNTFGVIMEVKSWIFKRSKGEQTTWLSTQGEMIGIQNKHIDELGMNISNYKQPNFKALAEPGEDAPDLEASPHIMDRIPSATIFERISAQCLYQVVKLNTTNPIDDVIHIWLPGFKNRIYRERLNRIKPNTKVFKSQKLDKLLDSQHVKQITSRELLERLKYSSQRIIPRPSRIVKEKNRATRKQNQLLICLKLTRRKRHYMPESKQTVHWIRKEKQQLAGPQFAQVELTFTGRRLDFQLIEVESKQLLLKEIVPPESVHFAFDKKNMWIYAFVLIFVVLVMLPDIIDLCVWASRFLPIGLNNVLMRFAFYIFHIILILLVKST